MAARAVGNSNGVTALWHSRSLVDTIFLNLPRLPDESSCIQLTESPDRGFVSDDFEKSGTSTQSGAWSHE